MTTSLDQRLRELLASIIETIEDQIQYGMNFLPAGDGPDPDAILYAPAPITIEELLRYQEPPEGLRDVWELAHQGGAEADILRALAWHALGCLPDGAEFFDSDD